MMVGEILVADPLLLLVEVPFQMTMNQELGWLELRVPKAPRLHRIHA
jgi:hypothetical protein